MDDEYKIGFWLSSIIAALLLTAGVITSYFPTIQRVNTEADAPKIKELTIERLIRNEKTGDRGFNYGYGYFEDQVLDQYYSKEVDLGFKKTGVKVLFTLSSLPALIAVYCLIGGLWSGSGISEYFKAKAEFERAKAKKYAKTLDDLIKLQESISK